MPVTFDGLLLGEEYERPFLAELWGYKDWHAIGRGVFTPAGDNKLVLFVTKEKQESLTQYLDHFEGDQLHWEGERNHASDSRIIASRDAGDEIHLFYRDRHHSPFTYFGQVARVDHKIRFPEPSKFIFDTARTEAMTASAMRAEGTTHGNEEDFEGDEEGRKRMVQHVRFERSARNRAAAIKIHGTKCCCCRFDFNAVYGEELAREYIEIHHTKSITEMDGERVNPRTDLVPLCSNCHSMVHRRRGAILPVEELRSLIEQRRQAGVPL